MGICHPVAVPDGLKIWIVHRLRDGSRDNRGDFAKFRVDRVVNRHVRSSKAGIFDCNAGQRRLFGPALQGLFGTDMLKHSLQMLGIFMGLSRISQAKHKAGRRTDVLPPMNGLVDVSGECLKGCTIEFSRRIDAARYGIDQFMDLRA
jgi:hypothetical protein